MQQQQQRSNEQYLANLQRKTAEFNQRIYQTEEELNKY